MYRVQSRNAGSHNGMQEIRLSIIRSVWLGLVAASLVATFADKSFAQEQKPKPPAVPGPMLTQGIAEFDTPEFKLSLVRSSQTVAALRPKAAEGFDFTPGDILVQRSKDGYYHLG